MNFYTKLAIFIFHSHLSVAFPFLSSVHPVQVSCGTSTLFRNSYLTASDDIKQNQVSLWCSINVLHTFFICTLSHTPAQQVLAVHACRQGSHKLAYAVMTRWLLGEIAAWWKRHTHMHTHKRCLTVIRDALAECATETRPQLRHQLQPETTPDCLLKSLPQLIALIICFCFMTLLREGGWTESIIAFN